MPLQVPTYEIYMNREDCEPSILYGVLSSFRYDGRHHSVLGDDFDWNRYSNFPRDTKSRTILSGAFLIVPSPALSLIEEHLRTPVPFLIAESEVSRQTDEKQNQSAALHPVLVRPCDHPAGDWGLVPQARPEAHDQQSGHVRR